ncbi:MAG: hypothetical protein ABW019_12985 [Chitinophagaceae bacterium]
MNTLAYIIYLFITYIITVHVGLIFFRNGRVYILRLLHGDEKLTGFINRLLLTGYYLVNLGYAALMISFWKTVTGWVDLLVTVGTVTGKILLTLAVMHFLNMSVILLLNHHHQSVVNNKT